MLNIDLSGKLAVVTGGSGELGRAIVRTLAQAGANIAIHYYKNIDQAKKVLEEILKIGVHGIIVQADITNKDSVMAMHDQISNQIGEPDIIINNAVIQYSWMRILDQPIEDYEKQYKSSVLHNVLMAKAFVPAMVQKKWGRIIGINTECVMLNKPNQSAYVSGKRGMDGILRVLAHEIGEFGITVNQVAPGWIVNDCAQDNVKQNNYIMNVPLRRRGTDKEIAGVVTFLASDLADFITGAFIPVCGGNVMPAI
jgi:3-oxoacyl-[acyl-carrier protein] reductase